MNERHHYFTSEKPVICQINTNCSLSQWQNMFSLHIRNFKTHCYGLAVFKMDIFRATHGSVPKVCHRYPTLYLKNESLDTPSECCWHQNFFTGNKQIFLYEVMHMWIAFWYIISNSFNFSWAFEYFVNKHGYNFDYVSKNDYPGPS